MLVLLGAGLAVLAARRARALLVLLMPLRVLLAAAVAHAYPGRGPAGAVRGADRAAGAGRGLDLYDLGGPVDDPGRTAPVPRAAGARCLNVRDLQPATGRSG